MGFSRVFLDTDLIYLQIKDCGTRVERTAENELKDEGVSGSFGRKHAAASEQAESQKKF